VVRNPDGTITDRRDFENSLAFGGAYLLQNILGGTVTPGAWAISLGAQTSGNTGPCTVKGFTILNGVRPVPVSSGNCIIGEASGLYGDGGISCDAAHGCAPNLTRQQLPFQISLGPGGEQLVSGGFELTGVATTATGGTIDTVATSLMICPTKLLNVNPGNTFPIAVTPTLASLSEAGPSTCAVPGVEVVRLQGLGNALGNGFGGVFSSTLLNGATATSTPPSAVQVIANQTVQVTVVFTFD
jgi:hypothetical protein